MRRGAQDEEEPRRLPLVVDPGNRGASSFQTVAGVSTTGVVRTEAQLINCFAEKDPNSEYYMVRKRPGYFLAYTLPGYVAGNIPRGLYFSTLVGTIGVVQDKIYSGTTLLGSGNFGASQIMCRFQTIPSPVPLVVVGNGTFGSGAGNPWYTDGVALTQIIDPNFPIKTVPGFAYLDGTLYVMTYNGYIYGSQNTDDPTVWNPLNVIRAQAEPDAAVVLAKQLVYVVAIKQWTTEFFYDAGNATGSPLASVQGAILNWGCIDANSLQEIDNLLIWIASNRTSSPQVVILEDLHLRVVSTPTVDRYLSGLGTTNSNGAMFKTFVFKVSGHRFYVIQLIFAILHPALQNISLMYDIDSNIWSRCTDSTGNYWPISASGANIAGQRLLQSATDGSVFTLDEASALPNDNGVVVPVDIYTPNYDAKVDRQKMLSAVRISSDVTNGSLLQARYSDDDYQNWTNFRTFDLSRERPILWDWGTFYRRAFNFRHQCNTDFRIKSIDLQLDLGTS